MRIKILIVLPVLLTAVSGSAQQPGDKPPATGKSYAAETIKRPASTAKQYPSPVKFQDFTAASRLSFRHHASPTEIKFLPETMGAGVALIDFNGDGRLDLFFTNGAALSPKMKAGDNPEKSGPKYWNRLYRQNPDGTFTDVTTGSGLEGEGYSFGTATGDFDRDGLTDLLVTRLGGVTLYRNSGNGSFEDVTAKLGLEADGWLTSAGFFDHNNDGRLDLFVARYVEWDFEKGRLFCGDTRPGYRAYCHPDNFKPTASLLFEQAEDGKFRDISESSGIGSAMGKALGVAFADLDGDGNTDIFVANDNIEQQLFRNLGDGKFQELALPAGVAFDERGKRFAGMGVDIADYDNDGVPDVIITALSNETYPLYRNAGDMGFDYVTQTSGVAEITILGSGWGIKFVDADNDGLRDIFVAQGHVLDTIEKTSSVLKYKQTPLLMRNGGNKFQNISLDSGDVFKRDFSARGLATGDLDNDGDTDVVIAQTDGEALVLKNLGTDHNWIGVELAGSKSSVNGEGSRITVIDTDGKTQIFDVSSAGSYLSSSDPRVLVGLGAAAVRKITVRWPSGQSEEILRPAVNKYIIVKEKTK